MDTKKIKETIEMSGPSITELEIEYVLDMMNNCWYGPRKYEYVEKFEKEFANYHGREFGLMTPNCTAAIHLLLKCLNIGDGDKVVNQECTWVASAAAVEWVGAKNIFVDIDKDNWCMEVESLERSITDDTKAVIATGIYGNMPEIEDIERICNEKNIFLIEDSAEALGSKYNNRKAGNFGDASVFSFHRTKTMTTGEGGMLITNDENLFKRCKIIRDQGRDEKRSYWINELGLKHMPFSLQAALGYAQLKRIDELVDKKRHIYKLYRELFSVYEDIYLNTDDEQTYNGCWATTLVMDKNYGITSEIIMEKLNKRGLPVRPFFYPLSSMPLFIKDNPNKNEVNHNAYDIPHRGLTMPSALNLKDEQVELYAKAVIDIIEAS